MGPVSIGAEVQWNVDGDTPSIMSPEPKEGGHIGFHADHVGIRIAPFPNIIF